MNDQVAQCSTAVTELVLGSSHGCKMTWKKAENLFTDHYFSSILVP